MTDAFEWDEDKRRQNLAKHGVDFRHAVRVFEGAVLEVTDERRNYGEVRIGCLGEIDGRIYRLVLHTARSNSPNHQRLESQCQRPKSVSRA